MIEKEAFQKIYQDLLREGKLVSPRGQLVREIENYTYELPPFARFQNFQKRKLNVDYIKSEIL
jgi:hypothetical protein